MKIAIFTDSFFPGVGGTESATHYLACELSKNNQVMVCAPAYKDAFDDLALPYKVARAKSIKVTKNDYWAMPKLTSSLKRALNQFAPDVLHCQTVGMMTGFALSYGNKYNVPVISTVHTRFRACYRAALKSKFLAEILLKFVMRRVKKADCVCSVSHSMANDLIKDKVKPNVTVIRNGGLINKTDSQKEKRTGKFVFLFVGLVIEYKNLGFTLQALSKVLGQRDDFIFKIVGRGPDEKKFKKQVKKLGLNDHVEFVGVVRDRQKLNEYFSEADLFLFSSVEDTDGLVILEAGNANTPSVVIEKTGPSERIIDGQNGFICQNSPQAYADKILQLMQDRELIAKVGVRASEGFKSWEYNAQEYFEVYKDVISKKQKKDKV